MSEPTIQTLKRLFAHSGNRCAFPKCPVALTDDKGTKGKVCHIKGENPTSARYDATQNDEERRRYDNLILTCGNHHDVIDQDEESYTVAQLIKLKADHEGGMAAMSDADAERGAALIMAVQSVLTVNQSGGIAANIVHVHSAPAKNPRTADAIDRIWTAMLTMNTECSDLLLAEMILTAEEIDLQFKGNSWKGSFASVNEYRSEYAVQSKMQRAGLLDLDTLSIHVSPEMWRTFNLHRALIGRLGELYRQSFKRGAYQDWRKDPLFARHGLEVGGEEGWKRAQEATVSGAQLLINATQDYFQKQATQ